MSTATEPLKYLWEAIFIDGTAVVQPADDRSVNHVEGAEYNPSAIRDVFDKIDSGVELDSFILCDVNNTNDVIAVHLRSGFFTIGKQLLSLESPEEVLRDRKLIFHRVIRNDITVTGTVQDDLSVKEEVTGESGPYVHAYEIGYKGYNAKGKAIKKVVMLNGKR